MARSKAPRKRKGRGASRPVLLGLLVLAVLLLIPATMAAWQWWKMQRPFQGYEGPEKIVAIEPGMGASQILLLLEREGIVDNARMARFYLVYFLGDPPMKAGEYRFRGPTRMPDVLRKLVRGEVVTDSVTLVEGLTLEETADRLAAAKLGRREVLLDLMRSPELIADFDPEAPDLEGYLFPETYSFARHTGERTVVAKLVSTFRERFERQVRPLMSNQTVRRVVTLASIVEKEAQVAQERPLIAGVYANRLERGIGLGADPTVIYAMKRLGLWNGNIRRSDLQIDSPYNTYRYAGLPPGPICSPGLASLEAAADPADIPYLYFVSRNDGTHVFASTLTEHNRNVQLWQRTYWRERRARERAAGR